MDKHLILKVERNFNCPKTGKPLKFKESQNHFIVENESIEYPIIDGIIDFILEDKEEPIDSYAKRAKRYERIFSKPGLFIRSFDKIVWNIKHSDYVPKVVGFIPENFDGLMLEIPVGTGIFTTETYKRLPNATIIAADYSINMLKYAKQRNDRNNIKNVIYINADVVELPIMDKVVDLMISMNGYHAFPNKNKALIEMARVLKPNGQFICCFFIKGVRKCTDKVVKGYYTRRGWFKPPYYTKDEIIQKFGGFFKFLEISNYNSMLVINSQKIE